MERNDESVHELVCKVLGNTIDNQELLEVDDGN